MVSTSRIFPVLLDISFIHNYLEWVSHNKYIGIILDDKLSFKLYITDVCRILSKIRRVIYIYFFVS